VPRRGSIVHRSKVEKVPSGFGGDRRLHLLAGLVPALSNVASPWTSRRVSRVALHRSGESDWKTGYNLAYAGKWKEQS